MSPLCKVNPKKEIINEEKSITFPSRHRRVNRDIGVRPAGAFPQPDAITVPGTGSLRAAVLTTHYTKSIADTITQSVTNSEPESDAVAFAYSISQSISFTFTDAESDAFTQPHTDSES